MSSGKISQVIGPVVDVQFAGGENLPEINNALIVYKDNGDDTKTKIVLEVALELGDGVVRGEEGAQCFAEIAHILRLFKKLKRGGLHHFKGSPQNSDVMEISEGAKTDR